MATIVEFRASQSRYQTASRPAYGASAEIVIFPGVRYERWAEPAEAPSPRKKRPRDTIEIDE
jgi:hypothetical protein